MDFFYTLVSGTMRLIGKVCFRVKVVGVPLKTLPQEGPLLIAPIHVSYLDPAFIAGIFLPRKLDFFASQHLFERPFLGRVLPLLRTHPLVRENGLQALRRALKFLKEKKTIVIFPEGTRSRTGKLGTIKKGVAMLSEMGKCQVVPIFITGAFEAWPPARKWPHFFPKQPVVFHVGEPIAPCPSEEAAKEKWLEDLREAYVALQKQATKET